MIGLLFLFCVIGVVWYLVKQPIPGYTPPRMRHEESYFGEFILAFIKLILGVVFMIWFIKTVWFMV